MAWPLPDGLSRWSPSTGGGNESGLRILLLSAPANTLFVTPSTYLGHLTSLDMMSVSLHMSAPTNVCLPRSRNFLQKKNPTTTTTTTTRKMNCCLAILEPRTSNFFPCLIRCRRVSETVRDAYFSCSSSLSVKLPRLIRIGGGLDRMTESQMMAICLAQKFRGNESDCLGAFQVCVLAA